MLNEAGDLCTEPASSLTIACCRMGMIQDHNIALAPVFAELIAGLDNRSE
jgi:hypothetical protein